jgi:hypothetical protein
MRWTSGCTAPLIHPEPPDDALFLEIARSHPGDERAYQSWAEGRSMSTEHAVASALASID